MSKKLLQINVTANWGSTGKIAEQIGLVAMEHGWESYIAYGRMMNPSKSKLIKIGTQWDVYRHYAEGRFLDREGQASRRATKKFLKEVDKIRPDIIHLHNIHDHYMNYPLLFEYLAGKKIPVVWTQHDQWAATGHCAFNLVGCRKWLTQCDDCSIQEKWAFDRSKKNYELKKRLFTSLESLTIVPVSEWLGGEIKQSFLKDYPMRVIHNGIDLNVFKPYEDSILERYGIEGKDIVLGVAAVWDKRKGLDDFSSLSMMLPADQYAIVIVGKTRGRTEMKQSGGCQMIFVERTQNQMELAQLYSAARVFVNPTYQDNYPTTNLEAMACGIPVITYKTGGSPEAVTPGTGWVVEQGDVGGIANLIQGLRFMERSEQRKICRVRAEHEFDKAKCYGKYLELYDDILKK